MFIIITGNPVDGLFFNGPFTNADDANAWAEREVDGQDWWLVKLQEPGPLRN